MLTPSRLAALVALSAVAILAASCVADVPEDTGTAPASVHHPPGAGDLANMPVGPCATACAAVANGECDWQSQCNEAYGGSGMGGIVALCGRSFVPCEGAESAAQGEPRQVMQCYRICEHLH